MPLAGLTLLSNLFVHDFWNDYPGGNAQHGMQNFIKNLGIFAGLLLRAAGHPGERRDIGRPPIEVEPRDLMARALPQRARLI